MFDVMMTILCMCVCVFFVVMIAATNADVDKPLQSLLAADSRVQQSTVRCGHS
jgi:hypothetical protein